MGDSPEALLSDARSGRRSDGPSGAVQGRQDDIGQSQMEQPVGLFFLTGNTEGWDQ